MDAILSSLLTEHERQFRELGLYDKETLLGRARAFIPDLPDKTSKDICANIIMRYTRLGKRIAALTNELMRPEQYTLFQEFSTALQMVINSGADVRAEINGKSRGVLGIESVDMYTVKVRFISAESPEEQTAWVSPFTHFDVAFTAV